MEAKERCHWCLKDPLYIEYHDKEWGIPLFDEQKLFELLVLEGMQAGLSWLTILKKREAFRAALAQFQPKRLAAFSDQDIDELMQNGEIIRNRMKLESAVNNARALLNLRENGVDFAKFLWQFVDGLPLKSSWVHLDEVPCLSPTSEKMAAELKTLGFSFVGPKICYSFMQASGMVNDHLLSCFRHSELSLRQSPFL